MKFEKVDRGGGGEGSGKYLRLESGVPVKGVFRGEIATKYVLWNNGKSSEVSAGTPGAKMRYMANFVVPEGSSFKALVFEFGATVYDALYSLSLTYGDVERLKVSLVKNGKGLETQYHVHPLPNEPLVGPQLALIEKVKLHELEKPNQPPPGHFESEMGDSGPAWQDPEGLPF